MERLVDDNLAGIDLLVLTFVAASPADHLERSMIPDVAATKRRGSAVQRS